MIDFSNYKFDNSNFLKNAKSIQKEYNEDNEIIVNINYILLILMKTIYPLKRIL